MDNTTKFKTLLARFDLRMKPHQLPQLRGAVALDAGWENDLFHNHAPSVVKLQEAETSQASGASEVLTASPTTLQDQYLHRYPRIHYRIQGGKATLWGVNEGAQALRNWLLTHSGELMIGDQKVSLMIDHLQERQYELKLSDKLHTYRLLDYLALNQENYQTWQQAEGIIERMQILEGALTGHLLGFCSAMGYRVPKRGLQVKLLDVRDHRPVRLHGTQHMAFAVIYKSNLVLPPDIAIGRGIAHGYGVQRPTKG